MALPAGRYGVTFEQLRKIRKLPVNTIEMINDTQEGTARVENGTNPETAINAGEQFWHGSVLYTATSNISTSDTIVTSGAGANCEPSDTITEQLADKLNTYASDPTQWDTTPTANSTKPVISGGEYNTAVGGYQLVKDTVGWSGKNLDNTRATTALDQMGVDWVVSGQSITVSGTPSGFKAFPTLSHALEAGVYRLYGLNNAVNVTYNSISLFKNGTLTRSISGSLLSEGGTFEILSTDDYDTLSIEYKRVTNGTACSGTITPMVIRADILDPTYEPYHATVSEVKCDNSVIAPVEDGDKYSTTYSAGKRFIRGGKFCKTTVGVTSSDTPTLNTNYVEEPDIATLLTPVITQATTDSSIITLGAQKQVCKVGNVVNIRIAFNVSQVTATDELIANLGYKLPTGSVNQMIALAETGVDACYVSSSGLLRTRGSLPIGSYTAYGTYICV